MDSHAYQSHHQLRSILPGDPRFLGSLGRDSSCAVRRTKVGDLCKKRPATN